MNRNVPMCVTRMLLLQPLVAVYAFVAYKVGMTPGLVAAFAIAFFGIGISWILGFIDKHDEVAERGTTHLGGFEAYIACIMGLMMFIHLIPFEAIAGLDHLPVTPQPNLQPAIAIFVLCFYAMMAVSWAFNMVFEDTYNAMYDEEVPVQALTES